MSEFGTVVIDGSKADIRFERSFEATAEVLWEAITSPERLARWMADEVEIECRPGGRVLFRWGEEGEMQGVVTSCDPPMLLEYTWTEKGLGDSVVRFEIVEKASGTVLRFEHRRVGASSSAGFGAGWHSHFEQLAALLAGEPLEWAAAYEELLPQYQARVAE